METDSETGPWPGRREGSQGRCSQGLWGLPGVFAQRISEWSLSKTAHWPEASSDTLGPGQGWRAQHPLSPIRMSEHGYEYFCPVQAWGAGKGKAHQGVGHRPAKQLHLDGTGVPSTHPAQL